MYRILLIGAGQLGSRHLQGLLNIKLPISIDVVDPNISSLESAKIRASEIKYDYNNILINYYTSFDNIFQNIDICIIATTANHRFEIIKKITNISKIKNLILEKILFQNQVEYELTEKLLKEHNINCWVNCPRRMFSIYKDLRQKITNKDKITFTLIGGDWGLACNAIHFIDLVCFLSDDYIFKLDTTGLLDIFESKRVGFYEVSGSLKATFSNGSEIFLHSRRHSNANIKMQILSNSYFWEIDEFNGELSTTDLLGSLKLIKSKFVIPFQSQITNIICEEILLKNECPLPSYSISRIEHQQIINPLIDFFKKKSINCENGCPIT
jgi:predicted dehydrogenase